MICDMAMITFHGMILYDSEGYISIEDAMIRYGVIK